MLYAFYITHTIGVTSSNYHVFYANKLSSFQAGTTILHQSQHSRTHRGNWKLPLHRLLCFWQPHVFSLMQAEHTEASDWGAHTYFLSPQFRPCVNEHICFDTQVPSGFLFSRTKIVVSWFLDFWVSFLGLKYGIVCSVHQFLRLSVPCHYVTYYNSSMAAHLMKFLV